ncbi:Uu.00g061470.m01.CDS01 [Anthostomella pinea]|uniref:Uu.00g061470.m01.CDS01 n=1 Tax=Anthostomella pinea TaxID=933095 RepID=A0AAI8YMI5_9PEZI|nr:Uu.00g061470.m01.CDS01 [Anthostomella pinea]
MESSLSNGKQLRVLYSNTRGQSEVNAREFLQERVVGFDMQWFCDPTGRKYPNSMQDNVSMIVLACENTIALFHLGLHQGDCPETILAPTLQKIIESPEVKKAGLSVMGDFERLKTYLGLQPRAAFELHHLHRLVKFGGRNGTRSEVNTDITGCALSVLVEEHFGLPFDKNARDGDWSKPLTAHQLEYATNAGYASYMLKKWEWENEYKTMRLEPMEEGQSYTDTHRYFFLSDPVRAQLREWRSIRATLEGRDGSRILPDALLSAIVSRHPVTLDDQYWYFMTGMGPWKWKEYASDWMKITASQGTIPMT